MITESNLHTEFLFDGRLVIKDYYDQPGPNESHSSTVVLTPAAARALFNMLADKYLLAKPGD